MRNHHIADIIAILSIAVIATETQTNVNNILLEKFIPSSDVFQRAVHSSKSVLVYIRALISTIPLDGDILSSLITAHRVVGDAITACTLQNR